MFSGWLLVGEKKECAGSDTYQDNLQSVGDCAAKCQGTTSMFIFGTNDFGAKKCGTAKEIGVGKEDGCACFCETAATINGVCKQIETTGYRLYKYVIPGNHYCVLLLLLLLLLL